MRQAPKYLISNGTKIRTNSVLESTDAMMVDAVHIAARTPSAEGVIKGVVGGHGGDVYWVAHTDQPYMAAYCWSEFEVIQ